jgi:pSer/pThr/pTyr-binding forkhead associated (FHA) protein
VHGLHTADGEPEIVVAGHTVVVGRAADCEVTIHYPSASRRHLRLVPTPAGCRLEDLGSRHGTLVNGVAVRQPVLLRPRDTVRIGSMGPSWTYLPSYGAGSQDRSPLREVR